MARTIETRFFLTHYLADTEQLKELHLTIRMYEPAYTFNVGVYRIGCRIGG